MIKNAPSSAMKFAGGLAEAITHPVQTLGTMMDIGAGALQNALPKPVVDFVNSLSSDPAAAKRAVDAANAMGGELANRYGSFNKLYNTVTTDPVNAAADLSMVLGVGAGLTAGAAGAAAKVGVPNTARVVSGAKAVGDVGRTIDPLMASARPFVKGFKFVTPFLRPQATAINALREAGGPELVNALEASKNMATTPGAPPTLSERALEGGVAAPTLAAMERRLSSVNPEINRTVFEFSENRAQALQDQITRIDQQLAQQRNALTPQNTVDLRAVRDDLTRQLAEEQSGLAAQQQSLGRQLPNVSQRAVGKQVISGAERLIESLKREKIRPGYKEAFELAGGEVADISNIARKTEEILGQPLSKLDSTTLSETMDKLRALIPKPVTTVTKIPGLVPFKKTTQPIPVATLEQLDAIRKAINNDIASAVKSTVPGMAQRLRNLKQLHQTIDEAIRASKIPQAAQDVYFDTVGTYRGELVPRFKEGLPARLLGESSIGESRLLPDKVIDAALTERGVEQFLKMAQGDRATIGALRVGVADKFRAAITNAETSEVSSSLAAKFLEKHKESVQALGLESKLKAVQNEARALSEGYDALNKAAKNLKRGSASEMVDSWLKSPQDMAQGMARISEKAKDALRAEVLGRATDLKYVTDNAATLRVALGKNKFNQLKDTMQWEDATRQVAKEIPQPVQARIVELTKNFTPEELTSLQRVAEDVKRMQSITKLASQGAASPSPVVGKLGTESLMEAGVSAQQIPSLLKTPVTLAKNVWGKLEGRVNKKAAAALAEYMYRDPDAALAALKGLPSVRAPVAIIRGATRTATGMSRVPQPQEESQ
ncbi:MAG: hypothetical protein WCJ87_12980 [Burkholderiales bacterium]